jgi:uncharacterized NAD(P)/FAD-binding protein YdhS
MAIGAVSNCSGPSGEHVPLVAIVGGGCAGTLVAANLLRGSDGPLRVVMIERSGHFGPGVAYSTEDPQHLLNVPAQGMSAFCDEPSHFADWAADRLGASAGRESYLPRGVYGKYLQTVLEDSKARARPGRTLELVSGEAIGANRVGTGVDLLLADATRIVCDRVVLATGPVESAAIAGLPCDPRVVPDPWAAGALHRSNDAPDGPDESAGLTVILGTGLSAVDAALSTCSRQGLVLALSRGGRLPHAHLPGLRAPAPPPLMPAAPVTLAALERLICEHVSSMQAQGYDWRDCFDGLRSLTPRLWAALEVGEQRRFLLERMRAWETRRHRMAPAVAKRFHALLDGGRVKLLAGAILAVRVSSDAMEVDVAPSGSRRIHTVECARIVVCTGAGADIRHSTNPLLQTLLADGAASHDPLALGLRSTSDGALLDSEGHVDERVFTLGALRRGELWETTAVQEIRAQAEHVAHTIERSLSPSTGSLDRRFAEHPDSAYNAITRPAILSGH